MRNFSKSILVALCCYLIPSAYANASFITDPVLGEKILERDPVEAVFFSGVELTNLAVPLRSDSVTRNVLMGIDEQQRLLMSLMFEDFAQVEEGSFGAFNFFVTDLPFALLIADNQEISAANTSQVPLPGAALLFLSGIAGLIFSRRRSIENKD